jgi:hypothetical protein
MPEKIIKTDRDFEEFSKIAANFKAKGWRVLELYKYHEGKTKKFRMREIRLCVSEDYHIIYLPDEAGKKVTEDQVFSNAFLCQLFDSNK